MVNAFGKECLDSGDVSKALRVPSPISSVQLLKTLPENVLVNVIFNALSKCC